MFARLTALVGTGSSLPFDVTGESNLVWGSWTHARGKWRADGSEVSVFRVSSSNPSDPKLSAARNGVKRLRTLRHPGVLVFKETLEVEEKGEQVVYLITEPVTPLAEFLEEAILQGAERQEYLTMGFHALVAAVAFLNIDCNLIHGNICSGSIAVTPSLDWKLLGMDLLTEHAQVGGSSPLAAAAWLVASQYKPGEVARGEWEAVRASPPWAVDAWGLGCLMQELYSGHALVRLEDLRNTAVIPPALVAHYQKLLASNPARRLSPARLVESGVLRTPLVELAGFLESLALKDSQEKDAFFRKLPAQLTHVPRPVAQRKLLPLLANALEYGGAPPAALGTLLAIGETLGEEDRVRRVVPIIAKLFASSDRSIRRGLLENIGAYGAALPAPLVDEQIFPHVAGGFADANPYLRELTLKSMVLLGPKLGQKNLNQVLLKHLAKLQVDEEPSIRANTTVLLGTLAGSLSEATCKKVLLNAFTRALRDGFPPARAAGLRAIVATARYHSAEDAAGRILPAVGPLCVDGVTEVRSSALECVDFFFKVLRDNDKVLAERAETAAAAAAAGTAAGPASAAASGTLLTSLGWAASSLGLSRGAPGSASSASLAGPSSRAASPTPAPRPAAAAAATPRQVMPTTAAAPAAESVPSPGAAPSAGTASDGWDEDEAEAALQQELAARQRLANVGLRGSHPPAGPRASTAPQSGHVAVPTRTASPGGSDGWFDEEVKEPVRRPAPGARQPAAPRPRPVAGAGARKPMKLGAAKVSGTSAPVDFDNW